MQKFINVVALLSGLTSLSLIGGGVYVYVQKDVMIRDLTDTLVEGAIGAIADAVPDILDSAIPSALPGVTGGPQSPSAPVATEVIQPPF